MSSLWTPDGERPVRREPEPEVAGPPPGGADALDPETAARVAELTEQLLSTPAAVVVANHCFGLFELAALHLSQQPPRLDQAAVAIDALGAVVQILEGRLGENEEPLREGLAQLRLAFVQIQAALGQGRDAGAPAP